MKILITAFEPFGGNDLNSSYEVLKKINSSYGEAEIIKLLVPTVFDLSIDKVVDEIKKISPEVVISFGQSGGRKEVSIERVAINIKDASINDNNAYRPVDVIIDNEGETAYFASLPIKKLKEAIIKENIPVVISNTAGTYVCNNLMYGVLNYIKKHSLNIKYGFIHLPYMKEQVIKNPNEPSLEIEALVKASEIIIKEMVEDYNGSL